MRNSFNTQSKTDETPAEADLKPRPKALKIIESNLGFGMVIGVSTVFMAASMLGPDLVRTPNPNVPSWVEDFEVSPRGEVCTITDKKSGRNFISDKGEAISLPRGFKVSSSPSSCNVTSPDGEKTCQLRGWPIEPIC